MKSDEMIGEIVQIKTHQTFFCYSETKSFEIVNKDDAPKIGDQLLIVGRTLPLITKKLTQTNDWDFGFLFNNRIFFTDRMSAKYFNTVFKIVK